MFYGTIADTSDSKILPYETTTILPSTSTFLTVDDTGVITFNEDGYYEVTLCGFVTGMSDDNGAVILMQNKTQGAPLERMNFNMPAGTVTAIQISQTAIYNFTAGTEIQARSMIGVATGTGATATLSKANVLIRKINY